VTDWETAFAARVGEIAGVRRVDATIARASFNEGTRFDEGVLGAMRAAAGRLGAPTAEVTCFAGHDAGVLAARRPSGMLLVRNRAGVSHSPDEHVELEDAAVAARIALETLEDLR
jgi:N-carbamoyl-L-amino-acid hydrolase